MSVEAYRRDLWAMLETDVRPRELLARGIGTITPRPVGGQLIAEHAGTLRGC